MSEKSSGGAYADVNGLKLYYEIHGADNPGRTPLVLIHGGGGGIEMFGPNLPALAEERKIIAVDLQGHGRTADIDRPFRYELMADDVAALLTLLRISEVDVMGYSLGGGVALHLAFRRPDLVRRLVIISRQIKYDGFYPGVLAAFANMSADTGDMMQRSPMAKMYPAVNWRTMFDKMGTMQREKYDWSEDVAKLKAPTMLVFADADSITPEHIVEFWQLIGGGKRDAGVDGSARTINRLAIVPGTTHYNILSTTIVAELVKPFLD